MTPIQAFIQVSDLTRACDPTLRTKHVSLDVQPDGSGTICATDGNIALRYGFRKGTFDGSLKGHHAAPGKEFPKWGKSSWEFELTAQSFEFKASNKKGRAYKRDVSISTFSSGGFFQHWDTAIGSDKRKSIDVYNLRAALDPLHEDAVVTIQSSDGLKIVSGSMSATLEVTPSIRIYLQAGLLEACLDSFEEFGGPQQIELPTDNPLAPVIVRALGGMCIGVVMPRSK